MTEKQNADDIEANGHRVDALADQANANRDNIRDLTEAAEELVLNINKLNRETGGQLVALSYRARRNRMMIWGLACSILLDVLLTIAMAIGVVQVTHLTSKVDHAQQYTQTEVLCPLYRQFVNADTPAARKLAEKNGQDLKARDEAFRVIHRAYDALNCP